MDNSVGKLLGFYNKRWVFSIFESALYSVKTLNIHAIGKTVDIDTNTRLGDSSSLTKKMSFIQSKAVSKSSRTKFAKSDKPI